MKKHLFYFVFVLSLIFLSGCNTALQTEMSNDTRKENDKNTRDALSETDVEYVMEDFPLKYEIGVQIYEDTFLNSVNLMMENDIDCIFMEEDLSNGIYFSTYNEWLDFWDEYPDSIDKGYLLLYNEDFFEEHQLIWFYVEVDNNLCTIDVNQINYCADEKKVYVNVSWGEDSSRGTIDMGSTYIVANFINIQEKYPLNRDIGIVIQASRR